MISHSFSAITISCLDCNSLCLDILCSVKYQVVWFLWLVLGCFQMGFLSTPPVHLMSSPPLQPPVPTTPGPQPATRPSSSSPPQSMGTLDNSLRDYEYKVVCPQCFTFENFPGKYRYTPCTHVCEENVLAVKQRSSPTAQWVRVRERTNHRDFPGKYIMCNSVLQGHKDMCRYGEYTCSFAHNEAEQRIWAMEKAGKFSITDFILQNRNTTSTRGFTIQELLKKYGGFFTFVCRDCFYGRPPRISEAGLNNCCKGEGVSCVVVSHFSFGSFLSLHLMSGHL